MNMFLKTLRISLLIGLLLIIILTLYFISDRYVLNVGVKGISTVDIKNITSYLILPLVISILVIWLFEKLTI